MTASFYAFMITPTEVTNSLLLAYRARTGIRAVFTCLLVCASPVVLMLAGVIPYRYRFHVLILIGVLTALLAAVRHYSAATMGLCLPRLQDILLWTFVPLAILGFLVIFHVLRSNITRRPEMGFLIFFVLVSAPVQEFIYRSFIFAEFGAYPIAVKVIMSAVLYAFMHTIYKDPTVVVLTFVCGAIWGFAFSQTNNLFVVSISHAALGVAAFMFGVM